MDRKRKSVFASDHDDNIATTRAKKNHFQDNSSNRSSSKPRSLPDTDLRNDIHFLHGLVERFKSNSENGAVKFSADVLKAVTELSHALRHTSAGLTGDDSIVPQNPPQSHAGILPPLPPILDGEIERAVFTHPGVGSDPKTTYDRLEVLGDAYIELISTKLIWDRFQEIPSGRISQIRELLVRNETLADYATKYGLDIRASVPHDYSKQPKRWMKTKGDIFEAYVAAVVLSHPNGYSVAEDWLSWLWSPKLEALEEPHPSSQVKEALAKKIMGKGVKLKYIDEKPPLQHEGGMQTFFIGVYLTGWGWNDKHLGSGQGLNKTIAGNKAALQALENEDLINAIVGVKTKRGSRRT